MKEGDVVLTPVPQADGAVKNRPAIVLRELPPYKDFLVCGATLSCISETCGRKSQLPNEGCEMSKLLFASASLRVMASDLFTAILLTTASAKEIFSAFEILIDFVITSLNAMLSVTERIYAAARLKASDNTMVSDLLNDIDLTIASVWQCYRFCLSLLT